MEKSKNVFTFLGAIITLTIFPYYGINPQNGIRSRKCNCDYPRGTIGRDIYSLGIQQSDINKATLKSNLSESRISNIMKALYLSKHSTFKIDFYSK